MRQFLFAIVIFPVLQLAVGASVAWGGEIKIVDGHGLVRALKVVRERAKVEVELKRSTGAVSLVRNDGIAGEIRGQPLGGHSQRFLFEPVNEGVWQLRNESDFSIVSVVITPQ